MCINKIFCINMIKIQKIIRLFILSVIISTFLMSIFVLIGVKIVGNNSEKINEKIINFEESTIPTFDQKKAETEWRNFCLNTKQLPFGIVLHDKLFPLSFSMTAISLIIVLIMLVFMLFKEKILFDDKHLFIFFVFIVILSYFLLLEAWMDMEKTYIYNCIKFLYPK